MKLITLNTCGGVLYEPLMRFFDRHSRDTDLFCLQEVFPSVASPRSLLGKVRPTLFHDIQEILPRFNGYHAMARESDVGGLAIFAKDSLGVKSVDHLVLFPDVHELAYEKEEGYFSMGRDLQRMEFDHSGKTYTVFNFHGMWVYKGKVDTDKRIEQSEKLRRIFNESTGSRILCGDFNLPPDTISMKILSEGSRNLISEYGIASTRSSSYTGSVKFADYVIISPEVEVQDFKVLQEEVSDHLPLLVEFD